MDYEGNAKEAVLSIITQGQPICAALVAIKAEHDHGEILFVEDVANIVDELRLEGHLIIEGSEGYRIADNAHEVYLWLAEHLEPRFKQLSDLRSAMSLAAIEKFAG